MWKCYILERVSVLNGDGKDKLVLLFNKTTIQLRQVNQTWNISQSTLITLVNYVNSLSADVDKSRHKGPGAEVD